MVESITEHALVTHATALSSSADPASGPVRVLLQNDQVRVLSIDLKPGRELPPHRPEADLVLAILDGMGQLLVDDTIRPLRTGDLAVVRAGVTRGLRCLEGRLLALGVLTPPPGAEDHRTGAGLAWPDEPAADDPAEVIRAEHRGLMAGIADLGRLAGAAGTLDPDRLSLELEATVRFLREGLLPHAAAEERLVYPAVESVLRARGGATNSMALDHRRIEVLATELAHAAAAPNAGRTDAVHLLQALAAVVSLHFDKEEEDYLPQLSRLGAAERTALVAALRGHHGGLGG
jgi:quercetin dioxygenase-like cupin family protein/iron-sulfur cluster repair protein YtfE (RIC family)